MKSLQPHRFHLAFAASLLLLGPLGAQDSALAAPFSFKELDDKSLQLLENGKPVLVYNFGTIEKAGVPTDRARSTYVHPLYGLEGEVLTDDFPKDHYHHRGLFWAWPHIKTGGKEYDLWMIKGVKQQFEKWLAREAGGAKAVLSVKNGWYAGDRKIVEEQVTLTVHPAGKDSRAIDLDFTWTPLDEPMTLRGAEDKSYGGLTLRFAPRTNTVITTPLGIDEKDLPMTRLAWADLTAQFTGVSHPSGAAIFVPGSHPGFPPMWLTRHYGVLCLGWPGVDGETFPAGKPIRCQYRVWIHRGAVTQAELEKAYQAYDSALAGKPQK